MKLTLLVYIICQWHTSLAVETCKNNYLRPYNCSLQADYYWRDYEGTIPNDAIAGGSDKGQITYVGQILHNESLLPANIYPCQKDALSTADSKAFRTQTSIKILCGQHKNLFRWISTSINEMHLLTDFTLVVGGIEIGYVLNIGRVNFEQRVIIGKIFPFRGPNTGAMGVAKRDGTTQSLQSFEVLAYEKRFDSNCGINCGCTK